jgi:hypothetical protein
MRSGRAKDGALRFRHLRDANLFYAELGMPGSHEGGTAADETPS